MSSFVRRLFSRSRSTTTKTAAEQKDAAAAFADLHRTLVISDAYEERSVLFKRLHLAAFGEPSAEDLAKFAKDPSFALAQSLQNMLWKLLPNSQYTKEADRKPDATFSSPAVKATAQAFRDESLWRSRESALTAKQRSAMKEIIAEPAIRELLEQSLTGSAMPDEFTRHLSPASASLFQDADRFLAPDYAPTLADWLEVPNLYSEANSFEKVTDTINCRRYDVMEAQGGRGGYYWAYQLRKLESNERLSLVFHADLSTYAQSTQWGEKLPVLDGSLRVFDALCRHVKERCPDTPIIVLLTGKSHFHKMLEKKPLAEAYHNVAEAKDIKGAAAAEEFIRARWRKEAATHGCKKVAIMICDLDDNAAMSSVVEALDELAIKDVKASRAAEFERQWLLRRPHANNNNNNNNNTMTTPGEPETQQQQQQCGEKKQCSCALVCVCEGSKMPIAVTA